jgi:hypothetical protein
VRIPLLLLFSALFVAGCNDAVAEAPPPTPPNPPMVKPKVAIDMTRPKKLADLKPVERGEIQRDVPGSPEDVYRRFMLAVLTGRESELRPLVLDRPGVDALWKEGAYPPEVAEALAANYRTMKIVRDFDAPDKVTMRSPASPSPLDVVMAPGGWRVDPEPIIRFRKEASKR